MDVYKACGMKISREMADLLFQFGDVCWREGDFGSSLTALTNSHKLYEILLGKKHPTTIDAQWYRPIENLNKLVQNFDDRKCLLKIFKFFAYIFELFSMSYFEMR